MNQWPDPSEHAKIDRLTTTLLGFSSKEKGIQSELGKVLLFEELLSPTLPAPDYKSATTP